MIAAALAISPEMPASAAGSWIGVGLAAAIVLVAAAGRRRLRGTTLAAPAAWAVASGLALAAVEAPLAWRGMPENTLAASLWPYAAAIGTCCPLMAVLGAKRPQDRGWQWVVLSLWVVLLVPALQMVAASTGNRLEPFIAWRLLLAGLIAMGLLNYLPTRFALSALLYAGGQVLLLANYLINAAYGQQGRWAGLIAMLCALLSAHVLAVRRRGGAARAAAPLSEFRRFNERWLAFRNGWGAFWALRVLQRINQTAELSDWPVRLEWGGFAPREVANDADASVAVIDPAHATQIEQALDSLLRRFERP